ncbi:MAG: ATP-binding protein [Fimbriimonadaceae bacterium]
MDAYIQRGITSRFSEALKDTPVLVIQGPRQSGKSTLVQKTCNLPYVTLDDSLALSSALKSPEGWLNSFKEGAIIDEIQRAPQLMRSIKAVVDTDRRPGRFVLTGSANVLLIPKLSDSLAGRMEVFTLFPFSQSELTGQTKTFIDRWLASELKPGENRDKSTGGYPEPLSRSSASRQKAWFQAYIRALMDRDVRDLAQVEGLHNLPNLLSMLAKAPYAVQNITQLSRDTGIPATSLTRYISLLQAVYLIHPIPAWTALHNGKASKTARLAFVDQGIANYLGGTTGSLNGIEQFVAMELVKEAGWAESEYEVMHFRSTRQYSVPIVLGLSNGSILGITVIDRETPDSSDFDGLRFLRDVAEGHMTRGVVLTQGQTSGFVDETLEYAPLSSLWAN